MDLDKAKQRFDDTKSFYSETHKRMKEDLEFSNPTDPQQWDKLAIQARKQSSRPCETFDLTNQYIMQVVNDQRMNKPATQVLPVGDGSDQEVAEALEGIFRHIEYASRAGIADDCAIELAARTGLGWTRVVTEVVDPETNEQEIRIKRIHDSMSVMLDMDSTEPDGSDAMCGFVESKISKAQFMRDYPKSKLYSPDEKGWYGDKDVRVCEYFEVVVSQENRIMIQAPQGEKITVTEDEYWKLANQIGFKPRVIGQYMAEKRVVEWSKFCGDEVLETTIFPSKWIPLFPTLGYELWVDGKRYVCGLTRRMMSAQKAYNISRTSEIELNMQSPKAPFIAPWEAIEQFQNQWADANYGNKAFLPFNAYTEDGRQIPMPQRQQPPMVSQGLTQLSQAAIGDIESSIGMYRANLGAQGNETSGVAINARKHQGSIANYHYIDNMARMIEHRGRVILDMIPRVMDTERVVSILRESGEVSKVTIDPYADQPVSKTKDGSVVINPNVGKYSVMIKVGPGYTTMRQESAEMLTQIMQGNPAMAAVIAPIWARMQDWPESDVLARALLAMAPPPVQQAMSDEAEQLPPQAQAMIQQLQAQLQQAGQAMQGMQQQLQQVTQEAQSKERQAQMAIAAEIQKQREKFAHETEMRAMDNATKTHVSAQSDDTKREIAELQAAVNLMMKMIPVPPVLAQDVTEDLREEPEDEGMSHE